MMMLEESCTLEIQRDVVRRLERSAVRENFLCNSAFMTEEGDGRRQGKGKVLPVRRLKLTKMIRGRFSLTDQG